MDIEIKAFPASNGESILIKLYGSSITNILIDCGYVSTTKFIIKEIEKIKNNHQKLDLIILTHLDNDHINGARNILNYLIEKEIDVGEIWYNDYLKILDNYKSEEGIPDNMKSLINSLALVESKDESETSMKEKVGYNSAVCVSEYLLKDELYSKWNGSFNQKSVCIDESKIKTAQFNDVIIKVLGPSKSILESVLNDWEDYLTQYLTGEVKVKNVTVAKAFEKYFLALRNIDKKIEKSKCSPDDINDMLNYEDYDTDIINRSSITIIIEFKDNKLLFLGDSSPLDIQEEIENYLKDNTNEFKLVKVSHHGSKNNLSKKMIEMIDCKNYLISTNGKKFKHPDVEAIAKILYLGNNEKKIYFNYKPTEIIDTLTLLKKNLSDYIVYENEDINDENILEINL